MRSLSQRMLKLAMRDEGISTRDITEALWPQSFVLDGGHDTFEPSFLSSIRTALLSHEKSGHLQRSTWTGPPAPLRWAITDKGREWLAAHEGDPRWLALAASTDQGVTIREIAEQLYADHAVTTSGRKRSPRLPRLLIRVRNEMVYHEKAGRVTRLGEAIGSYNKAKSTIWKTTPEGEQWLRDNNPLRKQAEKHMREAEQQQRLAQKEHLQSLLHQAAQDYGPGTSRSVRRTVARQLRDQGCVLQDIANVFGVTRELIRLDCLTPPDQAA